EILLKKAERRTGIVRESDGKPVANATVEVRASFAGDFARWQIAEARPPLLSLNAGEDGRLELSEVGEGTYELLISARTYPVLELSKYELSSESPKELVFEYPELRFLHGLVRGPDGKPVSGATVRVDLTVPDTVRSSR